MKSLYEVINEKLVITAKVDKKEMELLPTRIKDKSIYRKIHKRTPYNY